MFTALMAAVAGAVQQVFLLIGLVEKFINFREKFSFTAKACERKG